MIPGPRPSEGLDRPADGLDRGAGVPGCAAPDGLPEAAVPGTEPLAPVSLVRTPRGWAVHSPAGADAVADLVEGMSLADLVAEELGALTEPDRTARRSARGPRGAAPAPLDPVAARVAELERTVAQLEHALAARVSTERAIGVLAERHGTSPRAAFEALRGDARSQGRPVAELAREVLEGLAPDVPAAPPGDDGPPAAPPSGRSLPAPAVRRPVAVVAAIAAPVSRISSATPTVATADGVS